MRKLCLITIALFINSCINIKVPLKYKAFNPYKPTDILVFKSSRGSLDTVVITRVFERKYPRSLPKLVGRNTLEIEGVPLSDYGFNRKRLATSLIVSFNPKHAVPSDMIFMGMHVNDNYILASPFPKMDSLLNGPKARITVQGIKYNDVIILHTSLRFEMHDVEKIYWSVSAGYLRIINKNRDSCELVQKYTDLGLYNKYKATPEY